MDDRDLLHRQLVRLGDMIGDGMHYEDPSISREYRRITQLLYPEACKKQREEKKNKINQSVVLFIKNNKCECGGDFIQTRDGGKVIQCISCVKKYRLKSSKQKRS